MVKIPHRFEDLYPGGAIERVLQALQQPELPVKVREALDRVGMRDVNPLEQVQQAWQQARRWLETISSDGPLDVRLTTAINATGQILNDTLTRVPMAPAVARAYANAAMEYQDAAGVSAHAVYLSQQVLNSLETSWHSSCTSALQNLVGERRVFVAKTDLIRIPGLGDLGAMLRGMAITEVGAANGCDASDWQEATAGHTASQSCILTVSPSDQPTGQGTQSLELANTISQASGIPLFELLADGVVQSDLAPACDFPNVLEHIRNHNSICVVPLNLLMGGPLGAMVVGRENLVVPARRQAALRGTELSGAEMIAAITAVQQHAIGSAEATGSPASCLHLSSDNLRNRAERVAIQLNNTLWIETATPVERTSNLGPGPWAAYQLQNWAIELTVRNDPEKLWKDLACRRPGTTAPNHAAPTAGEAENKEAADIPDAKSPDQANFDSGVPIASVLEKEKVILDLRFVNPQDDHRLVAALCPELSEEI